MSGTIRSRTEAIIAECDAYLRQTLTDSAYNPAVGMCERIRVAADDTLTDLNNARTVYRCRPGCADCDLRDEPWRAGDVKCAVIPDPDSRGAT